MEGRHGREREKGEGSREKEEGRREEGKGPGRREKRGTLSYPPLKTVLDPQWRNL